MKQSLEELKKELFDIEKELCEVGLFIIANDITRTPMDIAWAREQRVKCNSIREQIKEFKVEI